ncbi:hypothetical protein BDV12DRAFT_194442 [Aspergillus spectabilis]
MRKTIKNPRDTCYLCHPFPKYLWGSVSPGPAHDPVSRGFLHAVHHGTKLLVGNWLSSGIDLGLYIHSALYVAVLAGRVNILKLFVERGADPGTWVDGTVKWRNLVHVAASLPPPPDNNSSDRTVLHLLLTYDLKPNTHEEENYWTTLHYAAQGGNIHAIFTLLDTGASINKTEDEKIGPPPFRRRAREYQNRAPFTRTWCG